MLPIKGCKSVAGAFLLSICTSNICKRVWSCLPLAIFGCTWPSFLLAETVIFSYFPLSLSVPDSLLSSQSPRDKTRVTAWFFCFTVLVLGRNAFIHFSLNASFNLADIYIYILDIIHTCFLNGAHSRQSLKSVSGSAALKFRKLRRSPDSTFGTFWCLLMPFGTNAEWSILSAEALFNSNSKRDPEL